MKDGKNKREDMEVIRGVKKTKLLQVKVKT